MKCGYCMSLAILLLILVHAINQYDTSCYIKDLNHKCFIQQKELSYFFSQRRTVLIEMRILILFGAILIVNGHETCRKNSGLMKSIQYQLKLVEENKEGCDCVSAKNKKEAKIGFLAWNSKVLENYPADKDVIFDLVKTNQGKAYDPTTGIFTAPVDGLYSFSWTITTSPNRSFLTYLVLNEQLIARNHAQGTDTNSMSASQSAVTYMKKDDTVSIKTYTIGKFMHSGGWSAFSGFLIS